MSTSSTPPQTGGSAGRAVSTPNKWPSSKSYKEPVTLIVGTTKEPYVLHKDLLCFYSDFFRAAFNGSFKEAAERKVELPDTEVYVFEAFQAWLYTQKSPKNENISSGKVYQEWSLLIKLWIFGDKYQMPLLQNTVIDAILCKVDVDNEIPIGMLSFAYLNTAPSSPLRKAFVDILAYRAGFGKGSAVVANLFQWPTQACLDVMTEMDHAWAHKASRHILPKRAKCYYHVHAAGEHC